MSEQTLKDIDRAFKALEERDELLDKIKAEIYEEFMTINGGVQDKSAKKCMQIIDKYRESKR